jgi:hypothetical protein
MVCAVAPGRLSQDQPDRQDDCKRAQGDNGNFEMKTTIHLRASNRNLRARARGFPQLGRGDRPRGRRDATMLPIAGVDQKRLNCEQDDQGEQRTCDDDEGYLQPAVHFFAFSKSANGGSLLAQGLG